MCGISGLISLTSGSNIEANTLIAANDTLQKRGPDHAGFFQYNRVMLAHRRLSIIDVSESAHQPMSDDSGRYTIIFNGEFFNYTDYRNEFQKSGTCFRTTSDTEVLLHLYMRFGPSCVEKINGFFAFAIYDKQENTLFLARDRYGIKPLWYFSDHEKLVFASELKALIATGIPRVPDRISILNYLQLNYVPGPWSILEGVRKMKPGHFLLLDLNKDLPEIRETCYYRIPSPSGELFSGSYDEAKDKLKNLMEDSVQKRLISDVPLGAFLSGGIDSSVVVALAARHTSRLNTFSIGYKDAPMYDETRFARLVANRYGTNHTEFQLSDEDLYENLFNVLDYLDEPFADSSALAVNILCMNTRNHVTVALSGDGADEMFGGYNKHRAEWILRNRKLFTSAAGFISPILKPFEGARSSILSNKIRQLHRFAGGASMSNADRYWRWCSFVDEELIDDLIDFKYEEREYFRRKKELLKPLDRGNDIQDILYMDMHRVLPDDMLVKVDMMSMANSLEVRVPFLDYRVVDFAFTLPDQWKIDRHYSKKILREAFCKELPDEILHRGKHGFEVPLLRWFRTGLRSLIENDLLSREFIDRQGLFTYEGIAALKNQLFSSHPGEIEARIWGLLAFQYWWKKYMD